jgi:hypothetical protein
LGQSCPICPIPTVLSQMLCPDCLVLALAVLSILTVLGCHDTAVLYVSCPTLAVLHILTVLGCPDTAVLYISCPTIAVLPILTVLGCPDTAVLSCPTIAVLPILTSSTVVTQLP